MFEKVAPAIPAFFEFVAPVYFDGVGYIEKVAVDESFANRDCPACKEYVAACDGYLFVLQNGASTCVSSANVKFLAGKRASDVRGSGDGEQEKKRRRDKTGEELGQIALAMSERTYNKLNEDQGEWKGYAKNASGAKGKHKNP